MAEKKQETLVLAGVVETIRVPVKTDMLMDGGGTKQFKWAVTVKRCSVEQHDKYISDVADGVMTDYEVAKDIIVDWHMLKTDKGKVVPFSEENLIMVFSVPEYKKSLVDSLYKVMSGGAKKKYGL